MHISTARARPIVHFQCILSPGGLRKCVRQSMCAMARTSCSAGLRGASPSRRPAVAYMHVHHATASSPGRDPSLAQEAVRALPGRFFAHLAALPCIFGAICTVCLLQTRGRISMELVSLSAKSTGSRTWGASGSVSATFWAQKGLLFIEIWVSKS